MKRSTLPLVATAAVLMIAMAPAGAKKPGTDKPPAPVASCNSIMTLSGSGGQQLECLWSPSDNGSTMGTVVVDLDRGHLTFLSVAVRNSSPGDICTLVNWQKPGESHFEAAFDLTRAGSTYWTSPVNWCGTDRADTNGDPLLLNVSAQMRKGAVTVTLTPPQTP